MLAGNWTEINENELFNFSALLIQCFFPLSTNSDCFSNFIEWTKKRLLNKRRMWSPIPPFLLFVAFTNFYVLSLLAKNHLTRTALTIRFRIPFRISSRTSLSPNKFVCIWKLSVYSPVCNKFLNLIKN